MSTTDAEPGFLRSDRGANEQSTATVRLVRYKDRYVPAQRTRRKNDLIRLVGFMELFSALGFPANIWNDFPLRTFAKGLMITGGSLALLASCIALVDLRRSLRNIRLLRQERAFLRAELDRVKSELLPSHHHLEAWLSVNFRELGWEFFDRTIQDGIVGFACILVGTGTILAVGGATNHIYLASNLLSGYVGNGFSAFFGLVNALWSVYLWQRARRHSHVVQDYIRDATVQKRERLVFRNHQIYASVNGVTLLLASAGSLISSTMWWGYIILIPCIFASIFCNIFWRKKVGYDRLMIPFRSFNSKDTDIVNQISKSIADQKQLKNMSEDWTFAQYSRDSLLALIVDNEMLENLCVLLANNRDAGIDVLRGRPDEVEFDRKTLESVNYRSFVQAFRTCVDDMGFRRALDQERMLYELLGAHLSIATGHEQVEVSGKTTSSLSLGADLRASNSHASTHGSLSRNREYPDDERETSMQDIGSSDSEHKL